MVYANNILAGRAPQGHGIAALFANLKDSIAKRRAYNKTLSELSQLSDRELADLGLHHSQIRSVAQQAVYGEGY